MSARSSSSTSSRFYINTISILFLVFLELFVHGHSLTPTKFVVFGSSGKTGAAIVRRIFSENIPNCQVICPVRDMAKARALLGPESRRLSLVPCNLLQDGTEKLATLVSSADAVIICSAYSPGGKGGPDFKGSYKVDNLAAKRIIDSCVKGNVPKVVLISSLLTNGFRAGQFLNPQYLLLNAFGGILLQKRQAEIHLQKQNATLDYTIIRPGGLKDDPISVPILYGDQVAEVAVDSCLFKEGSNKIVEIVATADARQVTTQQGLESVR